MSNLYEILEICLQEIENGSDIDTVLFRHPQHADELRPILEASVNAKFIAVPAPSSDVLRRSRAKVLQQAAEMREAKARPSRRFWTVPLRRALVTLFVVMALFVSSTNLVRAASTTLPGDHLYPVKRTWEDVLVLFTFNIQLREALAVQHENERLHELKEVFAEGRSVKVDFAGLVTRQNGDLWLVSGIPVALSPATDLPAQPIAMGSALRVIGTTQPDGAVLAERIELLPAGVPLPEFDDDAFEHEGSDESKQSGEDSSGKGSESEGESPKAEATQTPKSESGSNSSAESEPHEKSFTGVIQSINGNILVINGQIVNISSAEIKGTPSVGASVKVEGYYNANGLFIVTKIEFKDGSSKSGNSSDDKSSDDGDDDSGSNDNGDDDDGGDDDNEDNSSGDNSNGDDND